MQWIFGNNWSWSMSIRKNLPLPQEIQGVMYENEITIHNYRNPVNYYVKRGDCDVKYLHLTREVTLTK